MRAGLVPIVAAYALAVVGGTASCLGMTGQDIQATTEAAQLSAAAYHRLDGGPERALIRGAACAELGVLRRAKVDAGALLECP